MIRAFQRLVISPGSSARSKSSFGAFAEIHRQTPIFIHDRMNPRARAKGLLRALGFILDMRRVAPRAANGGENNALHAK